METSCPCSDECPMNGMFKIIGGKWKLKIICLLTLHGTLRYGELKKKLTGINPTMLAESLRDLESVGVVSRRQYPTMPVRVDYSLTDKGKSLLPILGELREWSKENLEEG